MNNQSSTPAQLWLGQEKDLLAKAITYLQKKFCKYNHCLTCASCKQITQQQYYAIQWFYPEKRYTVESIEPIIKTTAFALEENQYHFFVIQKAELLTTACQNKLLKTIEEPPAGYHFIFLAEHKESILPTIQSRCTIKEFISPEQTTAHIQILHYFIGKKPFNPTLFLQALDRAKLREHESKKLLDQLLQWYAKNNKNKAYLTYLKRAYKQTPMPGSSKLFWKNMLLQLPKN